MNVTPRVEGDEDVQAGAIEVLRAGVRATPELRVGLGVSVGMGAGHGAGEDGRPHLDPADPQPGWATANPTGPSSS